MLIWSLSKYRNVGHTSFLMLFMRNLDKMIHFCYLYYLYVKKLSKQNRKNILFKIMYISLKNSKESIVMSKSLNKENEISRESCKVWIWLRDIRQFEKVAYYVIPTVSHLRKFKCMETTKYQLFLSRRKGAGYIGKHMRIFVNSICHKFGHCYDQTNICISITCLHSFNTFFLF